MHALLASRLDMVAGADSRVDWAMAEALAFGTLLLHRYRPEAVWGTCLNMYQPALQFMSCMWHLLGACRTLAIPQLLALMHACVQCTEAQQ